MDFLKCPLIVTDGFDFYEKLVRRVFESAALYAQVLKTRRNDRIVKVERRAVHGAAWRFEEALINSEDSSTLNTSFIERLNLTIRRKARHTFSDGRSATPARRRGSQSILSAPLLLQLRQAARRSEVRTRDPDSGDAGWARRTAAHVSRHLFRDDDSFVGARRGVPAHGGAQSGFSRHLATAGSRLATLDGGSTVRLRSCQRPILRENALPRPDSGRILA